MIVRDHEKGFIMIEQHDHARISGEIVRHWKNNFLLRSKLREEADWAIEQHDRAWIALDKSPEWNEEKQRPYTFTDYPLEEKLEAYQRGVEEVSRQSLYAGMLCSRHYQSFLSEEDENPVVRRFIKGEKERQEELFEAMEMDVPRDIFDLHFRRLRFCDDLSLYVCMNEPGIPKEGEVSWFKGGFRETFDFAPEGMIAQWEDDTQVSVDPFPFQAPFDIHIPFRFVHNHDIREKGFKQAYQEAGTDQYRVSIISKQ